MVGLRDRWNRSGRSRKISIALVAVVVFAAIAAGVAWAATPQPQKLIHACYHKQTGALVYRAYCTSTEKSIFWPAATAPEPSSVIDVLEPRPGHEPALNEGTNSIMTLTKPRVWAKGNREQVVLATLVLRNAGGFLPAVNCTVGQGSALFSVPASVGEREYLLTVSFQSPAGGQPEPTVTLACDVMDPPSPAELTVVRASLTVIPQN